MPFPVMRPKKYALRLWCVYGFPNVGKSTFLAQLRQPLLVVDADQRFDEVLKATPQLLAHALSEVPADYTDPDRIAALLNQNMPGSTIGTIAIDSLTTIISPLVTQAIREKKQDKMEQWKDKATAMRILQDSVSRWGCDVAWVFHLIEGHDHDAKKRVRATLSETERARLMRSINLQIELFRDASRDRFGARVTWARRGRSGIALWDEAGDWKGMPERIEAAVYDGLSTEEQDRIEQQAPESFPNAATAIAWGFDRKAFEALEHARNAYNKLKAEQKPQTAKAMRDLWVADVERRLKEKVSRVEAEQGNGENGHGSEQEELPF